MNFYYFSFNPEKRIAEEAFCTAAVDPRNSGDKRTVCVAQRSSRFAYHGKSMPCMVVNDLLESMADLTQLYGAPQLATFNIG